MSYMLDGIKTLLKSPLARASTMTRHTIRRVSCSHNSRGRLYRHTCAIIFRTSRYDINGVPGRCDPRLRAPIAGRHCEQGPKTRDRRPPLRTTDERLTARHPIAAYTRNGGFAPELPADSPLDHGLGGLLNLRDILGKRRAGSLVRSGATNRL
ncbi:hypothetical protein F4782DRAFT_509886 [Xylaria castorea]|nr:hypothetical protein F4782DRAFT_509886 [Xylaria castorea]